MRPPRVVLVLWPSDQPRDWLLLGTLRGQRVEYVLEGNDALVRVGDWISSGGDRPVLDELREMFERASAAHAPTMRAPRSTYALVEIDATDRHADPRREQR